MREFGRFLLSLSHRQLKNFLSSVTRAQCELIRQSSYNLFFNTSIKLEEVDRAYLRRYSKALKQLASKKVCLTDKRGILAKRSSLIKRIMKIVITYIDQENSSVPA